MKTIKIILLILCVFSLMPIACKKSLEEKYAQNPYRPTSTKELKVSSSFNWSTVTDFTVTLNPSHAGLLLIQNSQAEVYHKAFVLPGKSHSVRLNVPKTVTKVVVFFNGAREEIQLGSASNYTCSLK